MTRIISGSAKGRRLAAPHGSATRPTSDRVREAVFSRIASWAGTSALPATEQLAGLSFCDLYAGSGAVGLEAASRGAGPVLLVEADRGTAQLAARNASEARLTVTVRGVTVEQALAAGDKAAYDIIWADPPYDHPTERINQLLQRLSHGWLAPDGLIIVERSARTEPPAWPEEFDTWSAAYGETTVHFGQ